MTRTDSTDESPSRRGPVRPALLIVLCAAAAAAAFAVWYLGPWSKEWRYERSTLLGLRQHLYGQPRDFLAWKVLGLRLARAGDGGMAEQMLTQAYALNKRDPAVNTALGEVLLANGDTEAAFQLLKGTAVSHPRFAPGHVALGKLYMRRASYHNAVNSFLAAASLDAAFPEVWHDLAICYLQMQQAAKAQEAIGRALEQEPNSPTNLALKGSVDVAVGNMDSGIAAASRAAELAPRNLRIQSSLVTLLLANGRNDEDLKTAERAIQRIEKVSPDYPLLKFHKGDLARKRGDAATAVRLLEEALVASPTQDEIYYSLSLAYRRAGRKNDADQALTAYRKRQELRRQIDGLRIALATDPNKADLYVKLARLQLRQGDKEAALASVDTALRIDPNNKNVPPDARRLVEMRRRALQTR